MGGWNLIPMQVQEEDHNVQGRNILEMEHKLTQETGRVRLTSSLGWYASDSTHGESIAESFFLCLFVLLIICLLEY